MTTVLGVGHVTLHVHESRSLKDKRRVVRSLIERVRNRFNASVAEVGELDNWQAAVIGFVCISNSGAHADQMLAEIVRFIEASAPFGAVADVTTELIHGD